MSKRFYTVVFAKKPRIVSKSQTVACVVWLYPVNFNSIG